MADRLDKLIAEAVRSTYGAGQANLSRTSRGGGLGASRGGINRGSPGYPVPDIMDPKERPELQEGEAPLAKSPVQDDPSKDPNKGFSDWGDELAEAETPKELPKGIAHLEDLKPEEFLRFLEKYKDLPIEGGLEVSEKVDGSARISFGIEGSKVWTQSKHGDKKYSADQYPDQPMYAPIKNAHKALESKSSQMAKDMPPGTFFVAEVLYTRIPNSIEYGPNVIMIHGVHQGAKDLSDEESRKLANDVIRKAGSQLSDGKDKWKFEYKRTIDPKDVMVDVKEEFESLKQVHAELKKLEPNKLKAVGKGPYKAVLERFKAIQLAVKKKLVEQLRKQKSSYGPEGGDVEGLVFRDLESGQMVKLVDKEYFTALNKFLWHYRELLDKGAKVGDQWEFGVLQKFRNVIADQVLGAPVAKTPGFVKMLVQRAAGTKFPPDADTPQKKADVVLGQYVKDEKLMQGDFVKAFQTETKKVHKEFEKLRKDWDSKKGKLTFKAKGKTVKMDPLVVQRTEDAFDGMENFFKTVFGALDAIGGLKGELTKKVGLLKIMMGQSRFEKLVGGTSMDKEESALREKLERAVMESLEEAGPPPIPVDQRKEPMSPGGKNVAGIKQADAEKIMREPDNAAKLQKKGIDANKAQFIRAGTRGAAFDVGAHGVLKVTNDGKEAAASFKLQQVGKGMKYVVQIKDVFRFPGTEQSPIYGIIQEKLIELDKKEANLLNFDLWDPEIWGKGTEIPPTINKAGYDWGKVRDIVVQNTQNMARQLKSQDEQKALLEKANKAWVNLTQRFHISDMVTELSSKGIKFHDYHAGNVMKRKDGGYVVIDIGYSKVEGGKEPPVLEQQSGREKIWATKGPEDIKEEKPRYPDDRQEYVGVIGGPNPAENGEMEKWAESVTEALIKELDDGSKEFGDALTKSLKTKTAKLATSKLKEAPADKVGVTIGRYQPFHAGHAAVIRNLAGKYNKVIILVAGNKTDKKNPFSFDLRVDLMKKSLPDVFGKLEIHKAIVGGKGSGFVPGILSDIIKDKKSTVKADTAVEILVGPDRFAELKQQMDRARKYKEGGQGEMLFDPDMALVQQLPGVKNDDDTDRISGTRLRQAIAQNKKDEVKKMMDPHLVSNSSDFEDAYARMRKELSVQEPLQESGGKLDALGGEKSMMSVMTLNKDDLLQGRVPVDISKLKKIAHGNDGVAYDMGGGKVFKITGDYGEAKSSAGLIDKHLNHVVHVFDAFRFRKTGAIKGDVFGIVLEHLQPLQGIITKADGKVGYTDGTEAGDFEKAAKWIQDERVNKMLPTANWQAIMAKVREIISSDSGAQNSAQGPAANTTAPARPNAKVDPNKYKQQDAVTANEVEATLKRFQVDKILQDLKSAGIQFYDFHAGNLMKRGSTYVITDLGRSQSGGADPRVMEKIVEDIINEIGVTFTTNGPGGTQTGLRAGSSGWSAPQGMYTDDDVEAARDGEEVDVWSNHLPRLQGQ